MPRSKILTIGSSGRVQMQSGYSVNANGDTEITMDSLRDWVKDKGFHSDFFDTQSNNVELPYLDKSHPHYSKKLKAAIDAWMALQDDKTETAVKQKIIKWLEPRAAEYGLLHEKDDPNNKYEKGDINKTAIEEVAKLINWNEKGGAGSTPSN